MAENINVNPTPIQRNAADVAIELTEMHKQLIGFADENDIERVYTKYFSLASVLKNTNPSKLKVFITDDVKSKV